MNTISVQDVCRAARRAGEAVMEIYTGEVVVVEKEDGSPITKADQASHDILVAALEPYGYPILSEEGSAGGDRLDASYVWIVDPLDGTKDFINQTDEFSIMVGLVHQGTPVLGVVYAPAQDTLYYATRGGGAFVIRDGKQHSLAVSSETEVSTFRMVRSRSHARSEMQVFTDILGITQTIPMGSAGLKLCAVAEGNAEVVLYLTDKMGEWDVCAAHVIAEEAGAQVTTSDGKPIVYNKKTPRLRGGLLVSNGVLHEHMATTCITRL